MTYLLTALIAIAAGWSWGHSTARIRHTPMWACARCDAVALTAEETARLKAIERHFDDPADPRSSAA